MLLEKNLVEVLKLLLGKKWRFLFIAFLLFLAVIYWVVLLIKREKVSLKILFKIIGYQLLLYV